MLDLDAAIVELAPCAPAGSPIPLREIAFRADAWTPAELDRLRRAFAADRAIADIALELGRGRAGVADKIATLGLRRHSARPWTDLEDEALARRYGEDATATIAARLGRSCSAVYARAGALGLTEGAAPAWTTWEDAQLRVGYARGVPLLQLSALIGRPFSGLASRAAALDLVHANHPPDWSAAEAARALELAGEGHRYARIVALLAAEGFPQRSTSGFGQVVRRLGYGRGWGRAWTEDEDELLRRAYAAAASLTPLRARLGRTPCSIRWRAEHLGLRGTHAARNGWRRGADWTEAQLALLRSEYGRTANDALAAKLGRSKAAMFTRANFLGLVHGYIRPFAPDELHALAIADRHGVAIADLASALGRKPCSVSKFATNHGYRFGRRPRAPKAPSLADILALDAPRQREGGALPREDESRPSEETSDDNVPPRTRPDRRRGRTTHGARRFVRHELRLAARGRRRGR